MTKTLDCQRNSRHWFKNDVVPPQACLNDPLEYVLNLPPSEYALFNKMVYLINRYQICNPSQDYIAKQIGVGRQRGNVLISNIVRKGLLIKQKCYNTTSIYRLPSFFYRKDVCQALAEWLPNFKNISAKFLALAMLMNPSGALIQETQKTPCDSNIKERYIYINTITLDTKRESEDILLIKNINEKMQSRPFEEEIVRKMRFKNLTTLEVLWENFKVVSEIRGYEKAREAFFEACRRKIEIK